MSTSRRPPRRARGFGVLAGLAALTFGACSEGAGDSVERACEVVVQDCGVLPSMSTCLDQMGELNGGCIDCIAEDEGCGYASCERVPGCRIPAVLLPPAE